MVKIIGKKDEKKGFSVDSLIELANGVKMKIKDMIALVNGGQDVHEVEETIEIDLGNGKTMPLGDMIKLANKATDDGEESDEEKNKKKADGEEKKLENAAKFKNCGCGGEKDGKHMENCKMYNSDGTDKEMGEDDAKVKAANSLKITALENEVKALKEGAANFDKFVAIKNAKNKGGNEDALLLQNGTTESGSMEAGFQRAKNYFGTK